MFVYYYMTPDPLTIHSELPVARASALLHDRPFRHLPVVDGAGVLQGMVTDRDLRSACPSTMLKEEERQEIFDRMGSLPVSSIMSREFVSLEVTSTLDDALLRFKSCSIGALPGTCGSIPSGFPRSSELSKMPDVPCWFRTGTNRSSDHA